MHNFITAPPIYWGSAGYQALSAQLQQAQYSLLFVLVDSNTNTHCLWPFLSQLETETPIEIIEIDPGESEKNLMTCNELWQVMLEHGGDRRSALLNLGGGVITDMGGFVAALFKRGIDFYHIPTTLLAMVDAAHGGKTGIDLGLYKNQVGLMTFPKALLIDPILLESLSPRLWRSGLAEMLKHGLIADASHWNALKDVSQLDLSDLESLIRASVDIKWQLVAQDPFEQNLRKHLNFGHTAGHALESIFLEKSPEDPVLHGEAVAAGMIIESHLSMQMGWLDRASYFEILYIIDAYFDRLPLTMLDLDPWLNLTLHDKKNSHGHRGCTLLDGIGKARYVTQVDDTLFTKAFEAYLE